MGIDIYTNRKDYPSRCKWYKGDSAALNVLEIDKRLKGVFYAKDLEAVKSEKILVGSSMVTQYSAAIETPDVVRGIEPNDYVKYDGEMWRVESVIYEDSNEQKAYSKRPSILSTIRMVR